MLKSFIDEAGFCLTKRACEQLTIQEKPQHLL